MSATERGTGPRAWSDPLVVSVNTLGLTQITAWGTSYYCLGVLAKPIVAETGWAISTVFLGFSIALLVMGFISAWVGRLIDRIGGRQVMSIGTVIISAGLLGLSQVRDPMAYFGAWAVIGVGMRCALYDAAFAAVVQVVPSRGRQAISYLTLYGAYASTIFWVVGHYLNEAYGWRGTLMIFAAINLAVCLPLNWIGLSRREPETATQAAAAARSPDGPALEGRLRTVGIALFALIMSLNGFVFGVVSLQLVPLLESAGLAAAAAVWVASLKGHGQFAGRLVEIFFGRNLKAMTVARIALGVLPAALILLMLARGSLVQLIVFTVLLGASQGVVTIVRGALPLALFGTKGYGAVLGLIATPILFVNAFSPALFALIVDWIGWHSAIYALLASSIVTWIAIELMSRWYEGTRTRARPSGQAASGGRVS
ncbi:MAG: MFS transporter [Enhydrobacter sp.]|nr:MFS transporter [Enhydrobacter sp.]